MDLVGLNQRGAGLDDGENGNKLESDNVHVNLPSWKMSLISFYLFWPFFFFFFGLIVL